MGTVKVDQGFPVDLEDLTAVVRIVQVEAIPDMGPTDDLILGLHIDHRIPDTAARAAEVATPMAEADQEVFATNYLLT